VGPAFWSAKAVWRWIDSPATEPGDLSEMARLQTHFHSLIRARAGGLIREDAPDLPRLSGDVGSEEEPAWYPVEAMRGGFKYWWDRSGKGLRLMTESWSDDVTGSASFTRSLLPVPDYWGRLRLIRGSAFRLQACGPLRIRWSPCARASTAWRAPCPLSSEPPGEHLQDRAASRSLSRS
jgi:hypothetical protein